MLGSVYCKPFPCLTPPSISELFVGIWVIRIPVTSGIDSEGFFSPSVHVELREIATFFWVQVTCFIETKDRKL